MRRGAFRISAESGILIFWKILRTITDERERAHDRYPIRATTENKR